MSSNFKDVVALHDARMDLMGHIITVTCESLKLVGEEDNLKLIAFLSRIARIDGEIA